jgi:hypothetical protein
MKVSQRRQTNTRSPPAIYMVEQSDRKDLLDLMARTCRRYCNGAYPGGAQGATGNNCGSQQVLLKCSFKLSSSHWR